MTTQIDVVTDHDTVNVDKEDIDLEIEKADLASTTTASVTPVQSEGASVDAAPKAPTRRSASPTMPSSPWKKIKIDGVTPQAKAKMKAKECYPSPAFAADASNHQTPKQHSLSDIWKNG